MARKKWRNKPPPQKTKALYKAIWKLADGAVMDTVRHHPEYFTDKGKTKVARMSTVKRITGLLTSFVEQSTEGPGKGLTKC